MEGHIRKALVRSVDHIIELVDEDPSASIESIAVRRDKSEWVTTARLNGGRTYQYAIYTDGEGRSETDGY